MSKTDMPKPNVFLRQATVDDIASLLNLLNQCYRDDVGWTNEAHLIGGIRTTTTEIEKVINAPRHYLFVFPETSNGNETGEILGCIAVDFTTGHDRKHDSENPCAYIGMFAVHPRLQGKGVGNEILQAAETFAGRHLKSDDNERDVKLTMSILSQRPELLAYYQRRGYVLTGKSMPFPEDGNNGDPKVSGLELLELVKQI
ncbi:N-acetyltransferase [Psychrobacter sp.]|uniref:GNAT family N-acetyltransferase n=1 Tax=Psychrobacter sp. TaxID=56811 RepID=UPI0025FD97BE|nr:N-acetyltransferase [Psychrobacter sp.]